MNRLYGSVRGNGEGAGDLLRNHPGLIFSQKATGTMVSIVGASGRSPENGRPAGRPYRQGAQNWERGQGIGGRVQKKTRNKVLPTPCALSEVEAQRRRWTFYETIRDWLPEDETKIFGPKPFPRSRPGSF